MRLALNDESSLLGMQNEAVYTLVWQQIDITQKFLNNHAPRPTKNICQPGAWEVEGDGKVGRYQLSDAD